MNRDERATLPTLASIVEAILFASDRPVTVEELRTSIPEMDEDALVDAIEELGREYRESALRGVALQEVAGGYLLTSRPEAGVYVERFLVGKRRARLSRAALETLATIAYRQPITRGEIEDLRGVDCGHILSRLLERDLVTVRGRSEALGRPLLYGTTTEFLRYFGIGALSDLPALEEFEALASENPLEDPEIREALESQGLWSADDEVEAGRDPRIATDEGVVDAPVLEVAVGEMTAGEDGEIEQVGAVDAPVLEGGVGEACLDSGVEARSSAPDPAEVFAGAEFRPGTESADAERVETSLEAGHPQDGTNGHHQNGRNGYAKNGANGHAENGANGHAENGANGHAENGANGHAENGANGHAENGANGHAENGANGHAENGGNGQQRGKGTARRARGATAANESGGDDVRTEVERAAARAFSPETAVSAELEAPSFADDDDVEAGFDETEVWIEGDEPESVTEVEDEASR